MTTYQIGRGESRTFTIAVTSNGAAVDLTDAQIVFVVRDLDGTEVFARRSVEAGGSTAQIEIPDQLADDEALKGTFYLKITATNSDLEQAARWADCWVVTASATPEHLLVDDHAPFYVTGESSVVESEGEDPVLPSQNDYVGFETQAANPVPANVDNYIWLEDDGTLWKTVGGVTEEIGAPAVADGTTITGAGTVADPFVAVGGGSTVVTDGVTITGDGSVGDPLVAVAGGDGVLVVGADQFGAIANMPTNVINNYDDASIPTADVLIWKGADNEGTILTGMESYGLTAGKLRYFFNPSISEQDVGTVTLKHEHAGSDPENRFACPGEVDYQVDIHAVTIMMRGYKGGVDPLTCGDPRWVIVGTSKFKKVLTQALHLFPNLQVGTPAAPLSGSLDNYNPTGPSVFSGFGIAGSDLVGKNHTLWRMFVDAAGATLTGLDGAATNNETEDFGRVHVMYNHGPGVLTVAHRSGSSDVENQIWCPNQRDLKIPADGTVWLIKPYMASPDPGLTAQWRVIGTSFSNEVFPSVTTEGAVTTKQLILTPAVSPAALAKFTSPTSNLNPGTNTVIRITPHADGSLLDGIVPSVAGGDTRIVLNVGTGPLILLDEANSASSAGNRFMFPGAKPVVVPARFGITLRYDSTSGGWLLASAPLPLESLPISISVATLAATTVNNLAPVDATTGLPGRYAYWWKVSGQVGTIITGIESTPAGLPAYGDGDRILLTNGGSGLTISHAHASSSVGNKIYCPGGTNVVLAQYGSAELIKHAGAGAWMLTMKAS
jgi:hypothetical protein